jgi:PAT family beta-lactamase induction signal transducer AmpG
LAGGYLIHQIGILQSSIMAVALQAIACLMFVIQSLVGYHLEVLVITVGVESFCSGLIAAVFIACLSGFCRQPFTASHFTLLYSFGSLCRVTTSAGAGWLADHLDWTLLFLLSALAVIPAVSFIVKAFEIHDKREKSQERISA